MSSRSRTYYIKTYGCQMNKADSEKIAAGYEQKGYKPAKLVEEADVVVINTCSVRQSAEDRVIGQVRNLTKLQAKSYKLKAIAKNLKVNKPKIILTGCMLRYSLSRLKKMLPGVDEFVKLQDLIKDVKSLSDAPASALETPHRLIQPRSVRDASAGKWVPIMRGCDNFCTYCVVPYGRGREVSRPFEEIVCEVKELVKRDYKHVTLLGQNVNSYGKRLGDRSNGKTATLRSQNFAENTEITPFAKLLRELHKIKGLEKISFITSNPQDLTDDIIEAIRLPKIDRYLHLPAQSGDDEILKKMNRQYTAKKYLGLIKRIRERIPDIKIGTDIIVGFPGETKKQFENTVKLCRQVGFEKAYIAKYSPRPGTAAYRLGDPVSYKEKKRRWQILEKMINRR